jgi:NAD(P)-dependent dehydrogenase (short-subunit alcohol dehydrogenase family)
VFSLQEKVVVVTGGMSGIGAAVVSRFRAAGAVVVVGDVADDSDVTTDVAHEDQVAALLDGAVAQHGRLDVLVNNAGIGLEATALTDETTARMLRTFRVNTLGVLYGTKHAARVMRGGGAIVNVGSLASDLAWSGNAAYSVSKAGVASLTRTAAVELAPRGIRVNAVQPSMVETPMTAHDVPALRSERGFVEAVSPAGRTGTADEVAAAVHFLASDDCAYLTGQVLTLDGGLGAGPSATFLRDLS